MRQLHKSGNRCKHNQRSSKRCLNVVLGVHKHTHRLDFQGEKKKRTKVNKLGSRCKAERRPSRVANQTTKSTLKDAHLGTLLKQNVGVQLFHLQNRNPTKFTLVTGMTLSAQSIRVDCFFCSSSIGLNVHHQVGQWCLRKRTQRSGKRARNAAVCATVARLQWYFGARGQ